MNHIHQYQCKRVKTPGQLNDSATQDPSNTAVAQYCEIPWNTCCLWYSCTRFSPVRALTLMELKQVLLAEHPGIMDTCLFPEAVTCSAAGISRRLQSLSDIMRGHPLFDQLEIVTEPASSSDVQSAIMIPSAETRPLSLFGVSTADPFPVETTLRPLDGACTLSAQQTSLPRTGHRSANVSWIGSRCCEPSPTLDSNLFNVQPMLAPLSVQLGSLPPCSKERDVDRAKPIAVDQIKVSGPISFVTESCASHFTFVAIQRNFHMQLVSRAQSTLSYYRFTIYTAPLLPPKSLAFACDATSLDEERPAITIVMEHLHPHLKSPTYKGEILRLEANESVPDLRLWDPDLCSPNKRTRTASASNALRSAPQPSAVSPRIPFFPITNYIYSSLLPRLEIFRTVGRACPSFLGGSFPVPRFNVDADQGVGFIEGSEPGVYRVWPAKFEYSVSHAHAYNREGEVVYVVFGLWCLNRNSARDALCSKHKLGRTQETVDKIDVLVLVLKYLISESYHYAVGILLE
ncbi:hypothetical protein EDD16DRAFT_1515418 [Pisolithus croceorrhizus]|nr:hypothetical protein EDD16DRAFT_1515418 [Pisolithus croceorrhizus]